MASTSASVMASVLVIREPVNRPSTPRSTNIVEIVDGLDKSGYNILISNNPPLDPGSNELEQGPKKQLVHLYIQIKML
jgi:hypothetical protein